MAEFTKIDSWRRDDYIKQTGFATRARPTSPNARIADACAEALGKIVALQKRRSK